MKKMKWIALFVLAAALLLAGCSGRTPEAAPTAAPETTATAEPTEAPTEAPTATPETTATAEPTATATAEATATAAATADAANTAAPTTAQPVNGIVNMPEEGRKLYAAQLTRYSAALAEQWNEGRYFESGMSELATWYYDGDARTNIGVYFPDLDNDGSPEMVIGAISGADTDPAVLEIWTVVNGTPTMIAQSHTRDRFYVEYLDEDGIWMIGREGSSGAANSTWMFYTLRSGALELAQGVTYDASSGTALWYMTYDEDNDVSNDTLSEESLCQGIIDSHQSRYTALAYTPYSEIA